MTMNSTKVCCLLLIVCFTAGVWARPSIVRQPRKPVKYQLPNVRFPGSIEPDHPLQDPAVQASDAGYTKQPDPQHHSGQDPRKPTTLLVIDPEVYSKYRQARSTLAPTGQTPPSQSADLASTDGQQDTPEEESSEERLSPRQIIPEVGPEDGSPREEVSQRTSKDAKAFRNRLTKLRIQNRYSSEFDMDRLIQSLVFQVAVQKIFEVQMAALFA